MRFLMIAGLIAGFAGMAAADDDPMAVQRCVWSCLANNGPASNPAYEQCVVTHCGFEGQKKAASVGWTSGAIDGGVTRFAGVDTADERYGVYYFCDRAGRSELMIAGVDGPAGAWALVIDGETYAFRFDLRSNGVSTAIARNDGVLSALRRGTTVALSGPGLPDNDTAMPLTGSSRAISTALKWCG
jgi:hypothetical protein